MPEDVVSNRGPQFSSQVFRAFCIKLKISLSLTAYHPQSNSLAERTNQEVSKALQLLCETIHLLWAENALNNRVNPVSNLSLFQCVLGYHPQVFPWDSPTSDVPQLGDWFQGCIASKSSSKSPPNNPQNRRSKPTSIDKLLPPIVWDSRFGFLLVTSCSHPAVSCLPTILGLSGLPDM